MSIELSIVIPAFNEEALLPETLRAVQRSIEECHAVESTEIIVVDNNSTDRTAAVALENGVQVVFEPINQISRARNAGGTAARGRFLLFLDADTELKTALLDRALKNLRSGTCSGGGVLIQMDRVMPAAVRYFVRAWNTVAVKLGLAAGCFVYALREGFIAVGGFSTAVYAGEEIWFSRALKKWGRKRQLKFQVITDIPISTSSRKVDWFTRGQLGWQVGVLLVFPWLARSKRFCRIWYERPKEEKPSLTEETKRHG
ncbi:MAG: glycosyltransferase involved in cell wall biosynthesis [Verrucomicrobiales bacterium]